MVLLLQNIYTLKRLLSLGNILNFILDFNRERCVMTNRNEKIKSLGDLKM